MPEDEAELQTYSNTSEVRRFAGIEDDYDAWTNTDVNRILKGVVKFVNKEIGITSDLTLPVSDDLRLAVDYLCSSCIKVGMKDPENEEPWRDDLEMAMMFLKTYLKDPAAFRQRFGYLYQSAYLTRPANPEASSYVTTGDW